MDDFVSAFDDPIEFARTSLDEESSLLPEMPAQTSEENPSTPSPEPVPESQPIGDVEPPQASNAELPPIPGPSSFTEPELPVEPPSIPAGEEMPVSVTTTEPDKNLTLQPASEPSDEPLSVGIPNLSQEPDRTTPTPVVQVSAPELPLVSPPSSPEAERPTAFHEFQQEQPKDVFVPPQTPEMQREMDAMPKEQEEPLLETRFEANNPSPLPGLPNLSSVDQVFAAMDASAGETDIPNSSEQIERTAQIQNMIERDALFRNMGGI